MSQASFLREISRARSPVVTIAVSSGKGGVGKTSLSIAISKFLSDLGEPVCLIDADLGLANVDIMLGLSPKLNLYHVAKGEAKIEDVLVQINPSFYVLPGGSGIRELLRMTKEMRERIALEILKLNGRFKYIIADTAAGISDDVLLFCVSCQHNLFVMTPEPTSLTDAYALLKILNRDYAKREFKIILNMVEKPEDSLAFKYMETVAGRFLENARLIKIGEIPRSQAFTNMVREQNPDALNPLRSTFAPIIDKIRNGEIFRADESALSRLAIGILRFKGVSTKPAY